MIHANPNIGHVILMLLLLGCSGFFSGAETAFFNLTRRQIGLLQKSGNPVQNLTAKLLSRPGHLLSCLLLGNMIVNVLFFAFTNVLTIGIERQYGIAVAVATAIACFTAIVLLGEIFPKYIAYANSKLLSTVAALPIFLCMQVIGPIVAVLRFLIVDPAIHLILGPGKLLKPITTGEFKLLVAASRRQGLISDEEDRFLTGVVELGFLKTRDVMRPRVDIVACDIAQPPKYACEIMKKNCLTKLPIYIKTIDNIVGLVYIRQLLLQPEKPLEKLVQHVHFVPEQKTVESLLEFFRHNRIDTAVVVDEYGGIAGSVCLEDIAEEFFGPTQETAISEPIKKIGPFEYRLAGNLSIRDWISGFGIDPAETRIVTIAGLVTTLIGRVPKQGDITYLNNLKFTVEKIQKNRIETVVLTFEPIKIR